MIAAAVSLVREQLLAEAVTHYLLYTYDMLLIKPEARTLLLCGAGREEQRLDSP